jgi:hypothetical protein
MEKHLESLKNAIVKLRIADHIIYTTYPLIKDKRLLLKALDSIYESLIYIINSILQYDYLNKKITLSQDPKENFETFLTKSAKNYAIPTQEIREIVEFVRMVENHKKSPMEFVRREKVIILSDNLRTDSLDMIKMRNYLNLGRKMLEKAKIIVTTLQ